MTARLLTVGAAPNAQGFATIRNADGTDHGDTDRQPVGTIYDTKDAARLVACWNACAGLSTEQVERLGVALGKYNADEVEQMLTEEGV